MTSDINPRDSIQPLVSTDGPVLLLGGARTADTQGVLRDMLAIGALAQAPVVAADGGAGLAIAAGLAPAAVIGDFDSLSDADRARLDPSVLHRVAEQETTDFDKALRAIRAPVVVGVGFHGARLDHQLAAMTVLARHPDRPCILVGPEDIVCLCPPRLTLEAEVGSWLSLYPLGPVSGCSEGLEWPIDGLELTPADRVGTSNRVSGPVQLEMAAPLMLLILPRPALRPLLEALSRSDARWPARAG